MSRYIISPSASRDLNEISDYFLIINLAAGENYFKNLIIFPDNMPAKSMRELLQSSLS